MAAIAQNPDGIDQANLHDGGVLRRHATGLTALLLAALLGAAFTGVLAGKPNPTTRLTTPSADLEVNAPERARSGQFFEVRMRATAKRDIADLVIAVDPRLWRDWTVNTMIPAPAEESFRQGHFEFSYGALQTGDSVEIKIDAQLNPALFGGTKGTIVLLDGETELGRLPLATRVLP